MGHQELDTTELRYALFPHLMLPQPPAWGSSLASFPRFLLLYHFLLKLSQVRCVSCLLSKFKRQGGIRPPLGVPRFKREKPSHPRHPVSAHSDEMVSLPAFPFYLGPWQAAWAVLPSPKSHNLKAENYVFFSDLTEHCSRVWQPVRQPWGNVPKRWGTSADEWIRKLGYMYTMEYYSAIKKNTLESVLMRWMKLEPIIQSEVSQKEKHHYSILTHIYGI